MNKHTDNMHASSTTANSQESSQSSSSSNKPNFLIQKIYVKESNFASKNAPKVFTQEWKPDVSFNLESKSNKIEGNVYEVDVILSFTVKLGGVEACNGKAAQSGVFTLNDFNAEQLDHLLSSYCPSILFPFLRETIADLATRGGYPQLLISPVNFEALYAQLQKKRKQQGQEQQDE